MKRAKFENLEKQRDFFIKVKKKLGIGSKKLSERLGLKSRGSIESYTFMRTAPPVDIVKKLENISGINAKYQEIEGKIYRKKRGFLPMNPRIAEEELKKRFSRDFNYIQNLIKSDRDIKEIIKEIRKRNYHFDNSYISKCIGAYRTNLLSKIVKEIIPLEKEIILSGSIRKGKKTLEISFNLFPLVKILNQKKTRVGIEISEDRNKVRIFPLEYGRILFTNNCTIKLLITEKSDLKIGSHVKIFLNPKDFGFNILQSIHDKDSILLARLAIEEGFILDQYRSTPNNHKGDLSLFLNNKNIIIEITKMISRQGDYFKVGQCFVQKDCWPDAIHFLVCKEELLKESSLNALQKIGIKFINTDFQDGWELNVIKEIKQMVKNEK